ncbi:DMT family transporter [Azospirillum agricola]|uniref:DMT family transporter n=1 Tax=Azospirillum agricola TaxID=1720247 RepID=UPI000A0EF385|nr:DMT family transporter [Azospirillum agricola]SMH57583.1 EamA domain-containing membrane protein RarD [Azospirillum lipoferum]
MRAAYAQLALSMILVGLSLPASKLVIGHIPPLTAAWLRFVMVAVLLAPVVLTGTLRHRAWTGWPRGRRDWTSLTLLALFGMVLFNVFLLFGLRETSAVAAGILTSTIPAMTALCAALILRERIGAGSLAAIALAVLGILSLNLHSGGEFTVSSSDSLAGNALVFGAVVSEGLYGVFARRLGGRVAPLTLTFLANALSAALMGPAAWATAGGFDPAAVPASVWLLFVVSGLTGGLMAVVLWMRGIAHVPANRAGLFTGMIPAAGVLAAVLFLGEDFTAGHAAGLACVLAGIALGTGALRLPSRNASSAQP